MDKKNKEKASGKGLGKGKSRQQTASITDKDSKGRFVKGNKAAVGGAGRPPETNKREYLQIMRDTLTEEKWRALIEQMYADAMTGTEFQQVEARKLLFKYNLPQKVEMDINIENPVKIVAVEGFKGWGNG